ncbi:TPA: hypothetical protein DCW38_01225 [candidate division WOR-3 bacterium]|jgi:predicted membrane protein|uniref:Uncharacterized protein n=1 Tax=candidate division WOR-3 bacterium TaxID=2052148 RepID=A0A350H8C3_UNCW3|nr:hypothetical protein [candidate division WOR-3 bacterium]
MHKERRRNLAVLMFAFALNLLSMIKGSVNLIYISILALILFVWLVKSEFLYPLTFIFNKIVFILTFLTTVILVSFVYYVMFLLSKPLLYLNDKRFYKKQNNDIPSYYVKSSNEWKKNLEELF